MADSGIDWDHCAFSPDLPLPLNTFNVSKKKIIAYFAAGMPSGAGFTRACTQRCGSGDTSDDLEGHGTHTAGTACGAAPSSSYSSLNSMAAAAQIAFTDIQVAADGLTIPDDLYSGIFADAYEAGARIHSNSWGCGVAPGDLATKCNVYDSMAADVDRFAWDHEDFLVLVAAGNDGTAGSGTVSTPATCKNCITVGASEGFYEKDVSYQYKPPASAPGPQVSNLAEFSSVGSTLPDGRTKPDVVAPGLSIRSAASNGFISPSGNCGVSKKSGTSMATPAVAALVALTRQYFRLTPPRPHPCPLCDVANIVPKDLLPPPDVAPQQQALRGKSVSGSTAVRPLSALHATVTRCVTPPFFSSAVINMARPLSGRYFDGNTKVITQHMRTSVSAVLHVSSLTHFLFSYGAPCRRRSAVAQPSSPLLGSKLLRLAAVLAMLH